GADPRQPDVGPGPALDRDGRGKPPRAETTLHDYHGAAQRPAGGAGRDARRVHARRRDRGNRRRRSDFRAASGQADRGLRHGTVWLMTRAATERSIKIDVRDFSFYYGDFLALDGLTLGIGQNEITALIGP